MMQRTALIAGNWKMNGSRAMVDSLIGDLVAGLAVDGPQVIVLPPFPYLAQARGRIGDAPLLLGAQDLAEAPGGAFTGDVSAAMLADVGAGHVLVGHSERRQLHGETDAVVAGKFAAAHAAGLVPVLCLGETLAEREAGAAERTIAAQLDAVIERAGIAAFADAVVAYEPVWAIGTGKTATPEQAEAIHAFIRARLDRLDATIAGRIRILYGGSMKPQNAAELLTCANIDGGLIGGASLNAGDFLAIVAAAA